MSLLFFHFSFTLSSLFLLLDFLLQLRELSSVHFSNLEAFLSISSRYSLVSLLSFFKFRICVAMVLIRECDEMGRIISPVTSDEKSRLWEDSMNHATMQMDRLTGLFLNRAILVTR